MRTGSKKKSQMKNVRKNNMNRDIKNHTKTQVHTQKTNIADTVGDTTITTTTSKITSKNTPEAIPRATPLAGYINKHWMIFKRSFNLDSVMIKLMLIDIGFIITLFLSYVLIYYLWIRNVLSVSYLVSVLNTTQASDVPASEIIRAWNHFITTVTLILVLVLLLYMIFLSVYSALSHISITKNRFSTKLFLNFIYVYTIFTVIYLLLLLSIFYISKDILLAAWCVILFTILYLYVLLIFYLVTKDDSLSQIFNHGFKSMIRLHHTLPPILLALVMFLVLISIVMLIFGSMPLIVFILFVLIIIYLSNWMKKYLHHIIHS